LGRAAVVIEGDKILDVVRSPRFAKLPAEILGVSGKGRIRPGADADVVVLGTELTVEETIVAGEAIYHGGGSHAL
jgi:N-acetylglucosamine-6-phosphate deacetylase